ncbi:MAG TPA: GNAT family N-acetyltransferase [Actinomycetota bacterium]|jgi:ribosomal protein S18 acetylase RimI-like enzyme|nr:GNAT family N-acetyltransferase [Actinomycetota bacterium]
MGAALRRASPHDDRDAARLILAAAPSLAVILHDRVAAQRAAAAAFRTERSVFGYRFALLADGDAGTVGLVVAYPGRLHASLKLGTGVALARAAGARHVGDLVRRGRILDRLLPSVRSDCLYVSVLAVDPDHRRQRIGTALMERVLAGAERLGLAVALDVGVEDEPARRLYEVMGFRLREVRRTTSLDRRLLPTKGLARMERRA